jgi:CheY-like chemotaxis protein
MVEAGLADYVLQKPLSLPELGLIAAALRDDRPLREYRRATRDLGDLPQFPGKKLLVADDNPMNREVAATALLRFGVEIDLVEDGVQALAAIGRQTYDLVLMDCSMPEMDGFEATRRVRAMEAQPGAARLPIVALTAHVVGSGAEAWRDAGMDGVLHKPFTMRDLG